LFPKSQTYIKINDIRERKEVNRGFELYKYGNYASMHLTMVITLYISVTYIMGHENVGHTDLPSAEIIPRY